MRLAFGNFVLDTAARQLLRKEEVLRLRPKAFELLALLVDNRPRVVSKDRIRQHLWPKTNVVEGSLHVVVGEVRRALGDDPDKPRWVRTVPGVGYAFSGDVESEGRDEVGSWGCRAILDELEVVLAPGENVIGRGSEAAIRLNDSSVSRRHAVIHVGADGVLLEDCGSRNGTFHQGERLKGVVKLEDLDTILVGNVRVIVRIVPQDETRAATGEAGTTEPFTGPPGESTES